MAGATSATLVVHDTIAARPSSTSDNTVIARPQSRRWRLPNGSLPPGC
jgi:hypothetical protein